MITHRFSGGMEWKGKEGNGRTTAAALASLGCLRNRLTHSSLQRTNQLKSEEKPQTARADQFAEEIAA